MQLKQGQDQDRPAQPSPAHHSSAQPKPCLRGRIFTLFTHSVRFEDIAHAKTGFEGLHSSNAKPLVHPLLPKLWWVGELPGNAVALTQLFSPTSSPYLASTGATPFS